MKKYTESYKLGRFVAMIQTLDEAYRNHEPKGDDWAEQILPLFHANFESTMQISGNILEVAPEEAETVTGKIVRKSDVKELGQGINLQELCTEGIVTEEYLRGYHAFHKGEPMVNSDHSFNLGAFMATVTCMELAVNQMSSMGIVEKGEDVLLFLEVNFHSTMDLVKKIVQTLPHTATFQDKEITLEEVVEAYTVLDVEHFSEHPLSKERFLAGYSEQMDFYRRD